MKDYRLDSKADSNYIVKITKHYKKGKPTTLSVKFADGRVFKNISYDVNNISKLIEQQEKQAKAGIENISVFEQRGTKAGMMTAAAIIGGPLIGIVLASTTAVNPLAITIATGALTLGTLAPATYSLAKNASKVVELQKIKYCDEHKDELKKYPYYENALAGLSRKKRKWFEERKITGKDPFCITEIDAYSKNDLEQITANIETEKAYQFVYAPRQTQSTKK